ncbi:glycosyltransferase, partial [Patescibacteria group bacterium]|nr:glycosyltransferase [Patescibacteria group bacterium]
MKILYLITKPDRGGAQTNVLALATGLSAQGHQVTVGTGHQGWLTQELNMDFVIFKHLHRSLNPLSGIFYIFELRRFLNQNHFDLVHFHSSNSLIGVLGALGLADKPKTVATIHGLSILHPGWKKLHLIKTVYARVMKFLLKYFDRVIFVCAADKKFALNFQLVKPEQARMIYNGIDPNIKFLSRSDA